ncbi:MAG TPA: HAD-IA family hydrolase [Syntrophomonadaceae bacterium]|nr:HAD-IA family hydrolase [Syntrophomonadaceae bacterium]
MQLKAVIFDLDGTIIDSLPLIKLTFEKVFEDFGIPWGNGEVLKTVGLPLRDVAASYAPGRVEEFLAAYVKIQNKYQEKLLKAYPGAAETLETLQKRGYRLALATSKRRPATIAGLALTGLDRYLEAVVTVEDVPRPKPNPDTLFKTLELLKMEPAEAVYVGDSWYDILTGKNAGVPTIGVTWGMATREELAAHTPDFIVDTWEELLSLLDR